MDTEEPTAEKTTTTPPPIPSDAAPDHSDAGIAEAGEDSQPPEAGPAEDERAAIEPRNALDPRLNAYRSDLADARLEGHVQAKRFVSGNPGQVRRASAALRARPNPSCGLDTEALFGEALTVFEDLHGWAWVQLLRDGYVGYVPSAMIATDVAAPTHRVTSLGTFVYPEPNIKTSPIAHLSLNADIAVIGAKNDFLELQTGGFVVTRHIGAVGKAARDFVEVAERFIGTPYLWGGRTRIGIDCSGLLQMALMAAGLNVPRDTDMQQTTIGEDILVPADLEGLRRGDIVFWKGHVGIMVDAFILLHANAHHMATVVETLPEAASRIARTGSTITAIKRLPSYIS